MSKENFNCEFQIEGMHCAACELTIEREVRQILGVQKVDAVLASNVVKLKIAEGTDVASLREHINAALADTNYRIVDTLSNHRVNTQQLFTAAAIAVGVVIVFLLLQQLGITNLIPGEQINLPVIFIIGIVASFSSCMAVVGGLVLTISSSFAQLNKSKTMPLILFHLARLIAFFVLGGVIGFLGGAFTLSPGAIFVMNLILFGVMVIMGLNMLEVFPGLKRFQLRIPKSIGAKGIDRGLNVASSLAAILLGVITFFLPCGFTQSMQVYALTTGNFLDGAVTMLVFALGTLPALALISFASVKLSKGLNSGLFFKTAGFLILFFALFNFLGALAAVGIIPPVFNF
jgi:uncharacterized protein